MPDLKPQIYGPTDGDAWWVLQDRIRILVSGEQSGGAYAVGVNEVPPGAGPPPHVHAAEDELFYLFEGQLLWTLADKQYQGVAGDTVYLPRGIPHTFRNNGNVPAKFLLIATPSGFERFVASVGVSCPSGGRLDPPPITPQAIQSLMAGAPLAGIEILPDYKFGPMAELPRHRESLWVLGHHVLVKLTAEQTRGGFSVVEITSPPGAGIPPHRHSREDELFYVLEGDYTFDIEGVSYAAPAGTFVRIPRGVWHAPVNTGSGPGRMIDIHTPGGFEGFFRECGTPCTDISAGPPAVDADMGGVAAILARHGMEIRVPRA